MESGFVKGPLVNPVHRLRERKLLVPEGIRAPSSYFSRSANHLSDTKENSQEGSFEERSWKKDLPLKAGVKTKADGIASDLLHEEKENECFAPGQREPHRLKPDQSDTEELLRSTEKCLVH